MDGTSEMKKLVNDGRLDLKLFKQECSSLKNALNTVRQHKNSKKPISGGTIGKHIIALKAINRRTQFRIKGLRDTTYQNKLAVDQKTRQLQNLLYELEHLKESIQTCLEFRSMHEEINLIPEEEFVKTVGVSEAGESEHQQTLNRLYWELKRRKKLHSSLIGMTKSITQVKEKIAAKQAYLDSISKNLRDILEATRTLDSEMDLNVSENEEAYQSAFSLPSPLYIIYSKLCAYVNVKDLQKHVTVRIVGDLELARSVNSTISTTVEDIDVDSSEADDQDVSLIKRKKTHRKSKRTALEDEERPQHRSDSPHPLSVVVTITPGPASRWTSLKLTLIFMWLMRAKLVTVKEEVHELEKLFPLSQTARVRLNDTVRVPFRDLLSSEELLAHLQFEGRTLRWEGEEAVADSCAVGPESHLSLSGRSNDYGRTYAWANYLGGLQCLPHLDSACSNVASLSSVDASYPTQVAKPFGFIDAWFAALCRRLESRMSLNAEIHSIESGVFNLSESQKPFFPISKDIGLSTWDRITFDDISSWPRVQTFMTLGLIQSTDAVFRCRMTYCGRDVLTIVASIPPSYPDDPSLITLGSDADAFPSADLTAMHIQELETEVNCYWREMPREDGSTTVEEAPASGAAPGEIFTKCGDGKPENLLTCQLARIASCLPIFLANDDVGIKALCPQGVIRYRTRSRPLRFLPRLGVFTYR